MHNKVLLSIVIANYNYGRFLEMAIESVISQCVKPVHCSDGLVRLQIAEDVYIELIICDAMSTDNSLAIIESHSHEITWWCSEPDGGQSAAFNKGYSHASGRFLTWLNADDVLIAGALKKFVKAVRRHPDVEWFAGGSVHFDMDLKIILCTRTRRFSHYEAAHGQISVYSPSSFFSRRLYDNVGGIDEYFRYSMDTHLWSKFFLKEKAIYTVLPGYIFGFRYHPESKTTSVHFKDKSITEDQEGSEQGRDEALLIRNLFPQFSPMSTLKRRLKMDWVAKVKSVYDTIQYRGKTLSACGFLE